ncbi:radical SAM protein [Kordia sp.]|uniref:radical SAM protein n=1 Tax=Kordia sp. TaxID=1965332 RepID=UPI003D27641C
MDFNRLVLKVASRCNLNCSYCFMYNLGDSTFRNQPKFMKESMIPTIIERVANYLKEYPQEVFTFTFHGGEPLLIDKSYFGKFISQAATLKEQFPDTTFDYNIQTNGVLIDEDWAAVLKKWRIFPGVSLDGTKKAHDMYRVDHKENGSYDDVIKGLKLLKRKLGFVSVISVMNIDETAETTYKHLTDISSDYVNFLLPDYTHDSFPYESKAMGNWLIELYDLWIADANRPVIPFLNGLTNAILGSSKSKRHEAHALVIETNGDIEAIDSLKGCGEGFTKTNMNIFTHDFKEIVKLPLGKLYFEDSTEKLCTKCLECPVVDICKGGRLVHRHKQENGFNNPSVYCEDMIMIISHIQNKMMELVPSMYDDSISKMDATEIIDYLNQLDMSDIEETYKKDLEFFSVQPV